MLGFKDRQEEKTVMNDSDNIILLISDTIIIKLISAANVHSF